MRLASPDVAAPFVHDVLARDGSVWVRERSESMAPLVRAGDRLRLAPIAPVDVRSGQLIAYRCGEQLIVHRVLARDADRLITKADGLSRRDAAVPVRDVVARVTAIATVQGRSIELDAGPCAALERLLAGFSRLSERTAPSGGAVGRLAWKLTRLPAHVLAWLAR